LKQTLGRLSGALLFGCIFTMLLSDGAASGQDIFGVISGTATDRSGAAVPGVKVTIVSEETHTLSGGRVQLPEPGQLQQPKHQRGRLTWPYHVIIPGPADAIRS
jgi:hypothetical protein